MNKKTEFIINELLVDNFIEKETNEILLEETEDTGKSSLKIQLKSIDNLSIKNVDKKNTQMNFFQDSKNKSMNKRVDHIIFEQISCDKWKLHLIEMKSSVGNDKWIDIKGKFRASYLVARAIAAMLELDIQETYMYTTYEKVSFVLSETMPAARRLKVGGEYVKPQEELDGAAFSLNFGEKIRFIHKPLRMVRNSQGILTGERTFNL